MAKPTGIDHDERWGMSGTNYNGARILAPMVRIGTLPTRLLALDYGADLVYSEEIIDHKMLQCERKQNDLLHTVDYVLTDGSVVFRTCKQEKDKVVFQMGTSDAKRALKVGKMLEKDVAAIDINMGCPKDFSIKGGMGAALLKQPDKIKEILTTLVCQLSIPVTCKIRVLDTVEETVALAKMIETTGVRALGVHGRLTAERPRHANRNHYIRAVASALSIPVIANGGSAEVACHADMARFAADTGCEAVMVARAAQWNPSVFRAEGPLPVDDVVTAYLKYAVQFDNDVSNTKYCVQQIMREQLATPRGQRFKSASLTRDICELFGLAEHHDAVQAARAARLQELVRRAGGEQGGVFKRRRLQDGSCVTELPLYFNKKEYETQRLPKVILYEQSRKHKHSLSYHSVQNKEDKTFYCTVTYDGSQFASSVRGQSKKLGEQAAAAVCLRYHSLHDGRKQGLPDLLSRPAGAQYRPAHLPPAGDTCATPAGDTCATPAANTCATPAADACATPAADTCATPAADTCATPAADACATPAESSKCPPEHASLCCGPSGRVSNSETKTCPEAVS